MPERLHMSKICRTFAAIKVMAMRRTLFYTVFVFILLGISGCTAPERSYRIGVSQCLDDAWRQKMNYEMERELLLHPDMTLSRRIAYGSSELQCAQIDSFIRERVDLLIVSPNEAEEVKPAVARAYRAGIPVIVADRRVTGDEWTAFIGGDNYKVGQLMAQWIRSEREALNAEGTTRGSAALNSFTILEVAGLPGSTPATLRHKGLMDGLPEGVEVHSVMGSWYKENAREAVSAYLREHALPDVIIAHNDLMAIGAAEALSTYTPSPATQTLSFPPIMGVDGIQPGLQAIVDGKIECSATYSSRGDMVIATAAHILHGEPFVRDTVLETVLVDAKAAYPMLKQDEDITRDLETLHLVQTQTESKWKQMQFDRIVLLVFVAVFFILFVATLSYIIVRQLRLQTEIKQDILPQLENMQEVIQLSRRDEAFAERLKQIVDDHITDPNLNVEYLGSMLQLSRTQLFRRVKSITGKGPLDYIKERRLIRADQLLHTTDMTVQQVAFEFCFTSPGYFSKCYKQQFGHLPSAR